MFVATGMNEKYTSGEGKNESDLYTGRIQSQQLLKQFQRGL